MKTKNAVECDNQIFDASRSRQRRKRTFFTNKQLNRLEEVFLEEKLPGISIREELTKELGIREDRIQVWFQNRRARWRKREIKNKPSVSTHNSHPSPAWPETAIARLPDSYSGITSFLPCGPGIAPFIYDSMTEQPSVALPPAYQFTYPVVIPGYPGATHMYQPANSPAISEEETPVNTPDLFPILPPQFSEPVASPEHEASVSTINTRSCAIPTSYRGRRKHSMDEYAAAYGLLNVFQRQN